MSGKLPALTGKELIAVLEAQGWYVARVKGSHHVMRHLRFRMRSRCLCTARRR